MCWPVISTISAVFARKAERTAVITNTTTRDDMILLKERGISKVITTTPDMGGRSFGTNVIEALMVTLMKKPLDQIQPQDYYAMLKELDMKPGVVDLGSFNA
jgi:hypothetical protein